MESIFQERKPKEIKPILTCMKTLILGVQICFKERNGIMVPMLFNVPKVFKTVSLMFRKYWRFALTIQ